jgi:hypothetical protein
MGLDANDARWQKGRKVVLVLEQTARQRTRYRVTQALNSVAWQMGRMLRQDEVRRIIQSGVEVVVKLRKEGGR